MFRKFSILGLYSFLLITCTEPVTPEFNFVDGLVLVDALISTVQGASFVKIEESEVQFGRYTNIFVDQAEVFFVNTDTGGEIELTKAPDEDIYLAPVDFKALVGDTWELDITLLNGTKYKSSPETVIEPVPISGISATYDAELTFNLGQEKFVPGHSIFVDFQDPAEEKNYYYWNFRSFEKRTIRQVCTKGWYRNDTCIPYLEPGIGEIQFPLYYTYVCETDCWQIRYNENIKILDDEFTNGSTINFPVADVLLYTKEDILVEVQQFSLSKSAYEYYKVLKDIIDNSSGLNAPPPAPLIGNIFNPNNSEEYVLGRLTTASASTAYIFLERNDIPESQILPIDRLFEGSVENPVPPLPSPGDPILVAPCMEGRYVTGNRPENWPVD